MTQESLYVRRKPSYSAKLLELAPESFKAFGEFNKQALSAGALTVKQKELIAVAATHITGCPYCIEAHVGKAKAQEASLAELLEAIAIAAAVSAHGVVHHAANAAQAYESADGQDLYPISNIALNGQLQHGNPDQFASFGAYVEQVLLPGHLNAKDKQLVALGSALVIGNAYSIDSFTESAKQAGVSLQEVTETLLVAAALKAGASLAHRVNALQAYDKE
ncbi:alkylhydroperoxidase [Paenibacillaceae bacterium]|nr:alkylhydroperoxidase [Paenibacillaceae bacterium]